MLLFMLIIPCENKLDFFYQGLIQNFVTISGEIDRRINFFHLCIEILKIRTVPENATRWIHLKLQFRRSQSVRATFLLQDPKPKFCISGVGLHKNSPNHPSIRILIRGQIRNLLL